MKRFVYFFAILAMLLFACSLPTTTLTPVASVPPAETQPATATVLPAATTAPAATEPATATLESIATEKPAPQTNSTCNEIRFFLDPSLASGFNCQSMPEAADTSAPAFAVNPAYTEVTLKGYPLADRLMQPHIDVYPVARYAQLLPDIIPADVTALQSLINGGAPGNELPVLPVQDAAQQFHAQYKVMAFASGSGIRFITQYAQYADPVNNHDAFYAYQGLSPDGKYWISAMLPISNTVLPADGSNPPSGQFQDYITAMADKLNAMPVDSFSPTIGVLDALITSITIH